MGDITRSRSKKLISSPSYGIAPVRPKQKSLEKSQRRRWSQR